jgi:predicted transcriptional regulator
MPNKIKSFLEEVAGEKAPGPTPTFSVLHILRTLELVAEKPIGRGKLAEELKVGQGAVRTIIKRLKNAGLLSTSKMGCRLTSKGAKLWDEYRKIFSEKVEIERNKLIHASYNFAILARNCGNKIKSGIEQRDAAVKVGAKGAAAIIFKEGRFIIPSVSIDAAKDFPNLTEHLIKIFKPKENDVIVIGGADTPQVAEYGAMAATWTLLDDC